MTTYHNLTGYITDEADLAVLMLDADPEILDILDQSLDTIESCCITIHRLISTLPEDHYTAFLHAVTTVFENARDLLPDPDPTE